MTDKPKNSSSKSKKDTTAQPAPQRRLLRSRDERMFAGVAGGLGNYLGADPTLVRLGFVLATVLGGFGVLAYLVMAVLVPEDDGSGAAAPTRRPPIWALALLGIVVLALPGPLWGFDHGWWGFIGPLWLIALLGAGLAAYRAITGRWPGQRRGGPDGPGGSPPAQRATASSSAEAPTEVAPAAGRTGVWPGIWRAVALIALAMVVAGGALTLAVAAAWAAATGHGAVVAGLVIALGVALGATAFFAEGARRGAPWLLAVALLLAAPAGAVAAADIEFDGSIGEREHAPTTAADVPADGYELGVGRMVVDLRQIPLTPGKTLEVKTQQGMGQTVISVPEGACVVGHADAKAGDLLIRGTNNSGIDPEFDRAEAASPKVSMISIDASLEAGQIVVTHDSPDAFDAEGPGHREDGSDPEEAEANTRACTG